MKKLLPCFILLFLLTGCNAEYRITINNDVINDDIFIYDTLENVEQNKDKLTDTFLKFEDVHMDFKKTLVNEDRRKIGYRYEYQMNEEIYHETSLARQCYDGIFFDRKENELTIYTTDKMTCFDEYDQLENVTVYLTSNYKVLSSNADEIDEETYIWNINRENFENKPIKITLGEQTKNSHSFIFIIAFVIGIIGILFFLKQKNKREYPS